MRSKKEPGQKRETASVRVLPRLNQAWKEVAKRRATSKGQILEGYLESDERILRALKEKEKNQ